MEAKSSTFASGSKNGIRFYTAQELEAILKIDIKTIYTYARRELIPYKKFQSSLRFRHDAILDWIEQHTFRPSAGNRTRPPVSDGALPNMLTAKELEGMLKIDVKTIYSHAQRGLIPHVRIQSNLRFPEPDILDWIDEQSYRPPPRDRNGTKRRRDKHTAQMATAPARMFRGTTNHSRRRGAGRERAAASFFIFVQTRRTPTLCMLGVRFLHQSSIPTAQHN